MKKSPVNVAKFTPLDSKILIEPDSAKNSSILIPDNAKSDYLLPFGTVRAVGPGRHTEHGAFIAMDLSVGDRVQVSQWNGQAVEVNGQMMICMERVFVAGLIVDPPKGMEVVKGGKN